MTRNTKIGLAVLMVIAAVVALLVVRSRGDEAKRDSAAPAAEAAQPSSGTTAPAPDDREPADTRPAERTPADALPRRLPGAEARQRLERDIGRARERRLARERAAAVGNAASGTADQPGDFDKEYIQERVRELLPMIKECYENALAADPELAGTLVVDMMLTGEPDVGGIVETSEIDREASTLLHPEVSECLAQTMYALEIEPPPNGGQVRVRYPFTFRPR